MGTFQPKVTMHDVGGGAGSATGTAKVVNAPLGATGRTVTDKFGAKTATTTLTIA